MTDLFAFFAQNFLLSAAFFGTLIAWGFYEVSLLRRGFRMLSPQQLVMLINRENPHLIDLASNNEFLKAHIAGAVNMPLPDFSPQHKALAGDKTRHVVLYDRNGTAATAVAQKMQRAGFEKLAVLDGGLDAWVQDQLPCAKGR
jgi:rhodanese-related sulfurtransferase